MALLTGSSSYAATVVITRPSNTTAYTAGDVIGAADATTPANAGSSLLTIPNIGPAGGVIEIKSVELFISDTASPSGMDAFRLHLYDRPPAVVLDNASFDLTSAEVGRYLGFINLSTPVDLGSMIFTSTVDVNRVIRLLPYSRTLYAELETRGAYTPASGTVHTIKVNAVEVDVATTDDENLLWAYAGGVVPTLDLEFARTKTLNNQVTSTPPVTFTRASTGTFVDSARVLQTAAVDVPRFDHNPTTGESLGLLVEEQRTNSLLRSEEFDNAAWPRSGTTLPTITADAAVAPNGATTADLWTRAITGSNFISQAIAKAASAIQYTFSVFVKQSVGNFCALRCQGTFPNKVDVVFNLSSGTISTAATVAGGTFTGPSASITPYPNGWYRLTVTATSDTATGYQCFASFSSNGVLIDGIDSVSNSAGLLWGAQLEAGAFATSYIPTTTAAATRSADVASITGANFSSWYRQDEGTVFVNAINPALSTTLFSASDGTANNRIQADAGISARVARVVTGGITQANNTIAYTFGTQQQFALSYVLNSINFANAGTLGTEDTSATIPTVDQLRLGANPTGAGALNSTIKRFTFWPQRLSNSTLQTITQ